MGANEMPGRYIVRSMDPDTLRHGGKGVQVDGSATYCETAVKAVAHAKGLIEHGHQQVEIRDPKCCYHEPQNFDLLLARRREF
jgi:hypothetical protein